MIEGVEIIPLKRIQDERGMVMHMLKRTDPHFVEFGEIYFSVIHPGVIKAWHLHSRMTINYAVVVGNLEEKQRLSGEIDRGDVVPPGIADEADRQL